MQEEIVLAVVEDRPRPQQASVVAWESLGGGFPEGQALKAALGAVAAATRDL